MSVKFSVIILVVIFIASISSYVADASMGESDVIRVFNPKMRLTSERLKRILEKADLESYGFAKSEETRYETDENGEEHVKKITYYIVQDDCSRRGHWDGVLKERLPREFYEPELERKMDDELEARLKGRQTEYCRFGLEIHFDVCEEDPKEEKRFMWSPATRIRRRAVDNCDGPCACCNGCAITDIKYKVDLKVDGR